MIYLNPSGSGHFLHLRAARKGTDAIGLWHVNLKRKTLSFAGLLIFAILVMTITLFVTGKRKPPNEPDLKVLSDKVDAQIKDVLYTQIGDDDLKWEIKADTARYVKKENLVIFENVKVSLVMGRGRTFIMTGDKGEFATDKRDINIDGHVRVVSDRGDTFTTDRLHYKNTEKRITTDAQVIMENNKMRISGKGMSLSLRERELTLVSQVKAKIR